MSTKPRKSKHFSMEETCTLLDVWSDNNIQSKFSKSYKHDVVWEEISLIMTNIGFNRSKQECCNRVNNLKRQFTKIRKTVDSEEQLDNNPYWLRFITVENNKSRLDDENGSVDSDNIVKLSNDEFCTTELTDTKVEHEQGMTSATPIPFEVFKQSSMSSSPSASFHKGTSQSRTNFNKRQSVEDDYIKHILENDKLMLHNQCKRLKQDEELLKSATMFFNAMTTYVKNCLNNFESNSDFSVLNSFPTYVTNNSMKFTDVQHSSSTDNANITENHNGAFQIGKHSSHCNELQCDSMPSDLIKSRIESNPHEDKEKEQK